MITTPRWFRRKTTANPRAAVCAYCPSWFYGLTGRRAHRKLEAHSSAVHRSVGSGANPRESVAGEPTPHVCQFCETPLRDHWWDPCTYTPAAPTGPEPESLRERVARAIMDADYMQATGGLMDWLNDLDEAERDQFRRLADAALAVIRGEQ